MWWALAMQAGQGALGGLSNASSRNGQLVDSFRQNQSENLAIQEANLTNTIRTGMRAGILNVQRGKARMEAAAQGSSVRSSALKAGGAASAMAAASGSYGASVDAVSEDIQRKADEALNQVDANWVATQENFDQQLSDTVTSGIDSIRSARTGGPSASNIADTASSIFMGAAQGAANWASDYYSSKAKLGLGPKKET